MFGMRRKQIRTAAAAGAGFDGLNLKIDLIVIMADGNVNN